MVIEKVRNLVFFRVLIALVPLLFNAFKLYSARPSTAPTAALDRGELLIIAAALCATAVGDVLISPRIHGVVQVSKQVAMGAVVLILFFSSLYYADINAAHAAGVRQDLRTIRRYSIALFLLAFFACAACVVLAEIKP